MLLDLVRALGAAAAAVVLPGYFWTGLLRPTSGLGERLGYSCALSLSSVPVVALVLARLSGSGITLWIAITSAFLVLISGAIALAWRGPAAGSSGPIMSVPRAITDPRALALLLAAFLAALVSVLLSGAPPAWLVLLILVLLVLAAALAGPQIVGPRTALDPAAASEATDGGEPGLPDVAGPEPGHGDVDGADGGTGAAGRRPGWLREVLLLVVLAATAARAYAPVIRFDWPSIRGLDHFSHAVMAEQMLSHGSYQSYLVYPPGFPAISAVLARLSGLPPLALFAVIAPALLVLSALAAYVLATRLWGWGSGIAAAALTGLVLQGAYGSLADGRYPDLTSAYFLIAMGVAAMLALYAAPSPRSAALAAVLGAAPVLYHSVATLYEGLFVVLAAVTSLPYLFYLRRRHEARLVAAGLAGLIVLAIGYGWYTYGVGWPIVRDSASSTAVSLVLGSQPTARAGHVVFALGAPILWLGVLGLALLAVMLRYERRPGPVLAAVTLIAWCLMMYAGSRTAADGFPQRFERDLGAPLSVAGALAAGVLIKSAWLAYRRASVPRVSAALCMSVTIPAVLAVGVITTRQFHSEVRPAKLLRPGAVAAGAWLKAHNSGGTIVSTPMNQGITERSVLAMGGYTGLMYYRPGGASTARSLPTAGVQPLLDSQDVLEHPASCAAATATTRDDVRFVVLYRDDDHDADLAGFQTAPARYRRVFENRLVVIYAPRSASCTG
jgi:hypothetical protein